MTACSVDVDVQCGVGLGVGVVAVVGVGVCLGVGVGVDVGVGAVRCGAVRCGNNHLWLNPLSELLPSPQLLFTLKTKPMYISRLHQRVNTIQFSIK